MNPWILIAESGDFIEVPKGTFGAFKVSLDELLANKYRSLLILII